MTYELELFGDCVRLGKPAVIDAKHPIDAVLMKLRHLSADCDLVKDLPMRSLQIVVKPVVEIETATQTNLTGWQPVSRTEEAA